MNLYEKIKEIFILYTSKYGDYPSKTIIIDELRRIKNNINQLNKNIEIKRDINLNNLDILFIVKNGENYFNNIFPFIKNNLDKNISNLRFYTYENNSSDNTKKILYKYQNPHFNIKTVDIPEPIQESQYTSISDINLYLKQGRYKRYINILEARNNLLSFYKDNICLEHNIVNLKNNWLVLMDIDIIFDFNTLLKLSNKIKEYPDGIMFCANTNYITNNKIDNKYYDIMALNYGKYFNYNNKHNHFGIKELFSKNKNVVEIKTGFGGLAIIRKDILLGNKWDYGIPKEAKKYNCFTENFVCEHWQFCHNINKYGKIYLVKDANAIWIEEKLYEDKKFNPKLFIKQFGLF